MSELKTRLLASKLGSAKEFMVPAGRSLEGRSGNPVHLVAARKWAGPVWKGFLKFFMFLVDF